MKFIFVLIAVFAICSCSTNLEAKIENNKVIECIRDAKPIYEKIVEIVKIVQNKQWEKILTKAVELVKLTKETVEKCVGKKAGEITLAVDPITIVKVVIAVGSAIYNGVKLIQTIRNKK